MAEQKNKGVPFAISLNTSPKQYGLTGFVITRYVLETNPGLVPPVDITGSVDVDEFENAVPAYASSPVVSTDGFAKAERIGVRDPGKEILPGHVIKIGTRAYGVLAVDLDAAGDGTIDLAIPLSADIPAETSIERSGSTGNYRFTITENVTGTVQYRVVDADAYPVIDVMSQVLDIISGSGVLVDNSSLLL